MMKFLCLHVCTVEIHAPVHTVKIHVIQLNKLKTSACKLLCIHLALFVTFLSDPCVAMDQFEVLIKDLLWMSYGLICTHTCIFFSFFSHNFGLIHSISNVRVRCRNSTILVTFERLLCSIYNFVLCEVYVCMSVFAEPTYLKVDCNLFTSVINMKFRLNIVGVALQIRMYSF